MYKFFMKLHDNWKEVAVLLCIILASVWDSPGNVEATKVVLCEVSHHLFVYYPVSYSLHNHKDKEWLEYSCMCSTCVLSTYGINTGLHYSYPTHTLINCE